MKNPPRRRKREENPPEAFHLWVRQRGRGGGGRAGGGRGSSRKDIKKWKEATAGLCFRGREERKRGPGAFFNVGFLIFPSFLARRPISPPFPLG